MFGKSMESFKVCKEKLDIIDHRYFVNHVLYQ